MNGGGKIKVSRRSKRPQALPAWLNSLPNIDELILDRVVLQGELKLRSFEKTPVLVAIKVSVPGNPLTASNDGDRWSDPDKLVLRERQGSVAWELTLEPGETKTLEYTYERYVRSN